MRLTKVKLLDVPKPPGKPTLPDDVWSRFLGEVEPLLKKRGTVSAVAKATGLTASAVSQWKSSKNRPTFHNALKALRALGCDDTKIATVLGADPRFLSKPEGSRNLVMALGVPEAQLAELWDNDSIGEEMQQFEDKFQRAARALMHSEKCTLQEALAAVVEAHKHSVGNSRSASWGPLEWAQQAAGYVKAGSKSGERPSTRLKKSGGS